MIEKLLSYFKPKNNISTDTNSSLNSLSIIMDNPDPLLKLIITNTTEEEAKRFANMLYELHQGHHIDTIIRILADMAQQDQTIRSFVGLVLVEWSKKYKSGAIPKNNIYPSSNTNIDNEPAIKPTHFFKFIRNE